MASRKPLVIIDGLVQQLPSGDTLNAPVTEVDVVSKVNDNASTLPPGTPVYVKSNGNADEAQANNIATVQVLGFYTASVLTTASGLVQTDGVLALSTGEWDAITGGSGGLDPGVVYYLDHDTAGLMTDTPTTDVGDFVVRLGKAISTTEFEISIEAPIKL